MSQSPLVALHATLQEAEQFVAGFEGDASQQPPVTTLLASLRAQLQATEAAINVEAASAAAAAANAAIGATVTPNEPVKAARTAIRRLLLRIEHDPRVAYHFDPITRSMEDLTHAYALLYGQDVEAFRSAYFPRLRFEAPKCRSCGGAA